MSKLLDFATMAEGFENLQSGKKSDALLIEAIKETTKLVRPSQAH
jgi:hypothetical protein